MALSEKAQTVKNTLLSVVAEKRELDVIEQEWQDLLTADGDYDEDDISLVTLLYRERQVLRRAVAKGQLRNWARLQSVPLTPPMRRMMRLRYVQAHTWNEIADLMGKSKQYLIREHNKILEQMA